MKRPRTMIDHIDNEAEAADMLRTASPAWREFYDLVRRAVEAKARADLSESPRHRKTAAGVWTDLQDQLRYLAAAEVDPADGDVALDFTKGGELNPTPPEPQFICSAETPCCTRRDEYNGYASGPTIFTCPRHCSCHD